MSGRLSEREAWAVLAAAEGVGPVAFGSLMRRFGSASEVLRTARADRGRRLRHPPSDPGLTGPDPLRDGRLVSAIARAADAASDLRAAIAACGADIVTLDDPDYPDRLRRIEAAPPVLYMRGDRMALATRRAVAVVGTRRPSEHGRLTAARLSGAISRAGAAVVSGLAVGIDGIAHDAALRESGPTIGVLGSGHLRPYPLAHRGLARHIERAGGAIVSELPPSVRPSQHTFPRRNRIISGLGDATLVVEAGLGSGALITARYALEQGRECFIVPGPIGSRTAAGSLAFLRDHAGLARIVAGVDELIDDLGLAEDGRAAVLMPLEGSPLGPTEAAVAQAVCDGRATLDALAGETGLPTATILGALTRLELRGLVVEAYGRYRAHGFLATRDLRASAGRPVARFAGPSGPVLP